MPDFNPRLRVLMMPPIAWNTDHRPGVEPDPLRLFEALRCLGIDVDVLNPGQRPWNPFSGHGTFLQALDPLRALRVMLKGRHYDYVISVFQAGAVPLALLRGLFGYRVPIGLWDMNLEPDWRLGQWAMGFVAPRLQLLLTLTEVQRRYIEQTWASSSTEVISHYVDEQFYTPGVPPALDGYALSVGNDVGRDYAVLLDACGNGGGREVVIRTNLALDEAPRRVRVVRERLPYTELRELYRGARYVIVPLKPTLNPSGVSAILEAAAMGRPAIVTDVEASRAFVCADETALVVPQGDSAALAAAMSRLDADDELCRSLGENARRLVEREYSVDAFASRFAAALRNRLMAG
ncbi:MAG: glycosyltransferase family 4 protein [Acidihalobacter sp.]|jgi:glycosyltransferase involved in cell wall biosynthesis|uniref:glycosyltransferase family 4 protein n=1 Tax=Acidihalobacter sp. TaxID=1872108 RepID=UPI00307DAF59